MNHSSGRIDIAQKMVVEALFFTYKLWQKLGVNGAQKTSLKNKWGDESLVFDQKAEKAIILYLENSGQSLLLHGEEQPDVITIGSNPTMTAYMDGCDGSGTMVTDFAHGPYGTMFAIFDGTNPCYDDYLAAGVMHHTIGTMFHCGRGTGVTQWSIPNGGCNSEHVVRVSKAQKLSAAAGKTYFDMHWPTCQKAFDSKVLEFMGSKCRLCSCVYYTDLARGVANLVGECARGTVKPTLEPAIAYGLVKEAGGVMVDMNSNSLGSWQYGVSDQDGSQLIISAATQQLAQAFIGYLKNRK